MLSAVACRNRCSTAMQLLPPTKFTVLNHKQHRLQEDLQQCQSRSAPAKLHKGHREGLWSKSYCFSVQAGLTLEMIATIKYQTRLLSLC